jgi:hypothetical protein
MKVVFSIVRYLTPDGDLFIASIIGSGEPVYRGFDAQAARTEVLRTCERRRFRLGGIDCRPATLEETRSSGVLDEYTKKQVFDHARANGIPPLVAARSVLNAADVADAFISKVRAAARSRRKGTPNAS